MLGNGNTRSLISPMLKFIGTPETQHLRRDMRRRFLLEEVSIGVTNKFPATRASRIASPYELGDSVVDHPVTFC
jgi:hypothetical protein